MTPIFFIGMLIVGVCYSSPTNMIETTIETTTSTTATQEYMTNMNQCDNNSQCGPNHCCVLYPSRYSIPACIPMGAINEPCRPGEPRLYNTTLWYPNGKYINAFNVNYVICPCLDGLLCHPKKGICIKSSKGLVKKLFGTPLVMNDN